MSQAEHRPQPSIVGLEIVVPRACQCGATVVTIGSSSGPHHARLECSKCGGYRGWLSGATFEFITTAINTFGRPTEPIVVKTNSHVGADNCNSNNTPTER